MSQDAAHTRYADWDGAYVLGALAPAERRDYEKHLEQCERCRASVAELTSMPGLLARLGAERAQGLLDDIPDSILDGTVQAGPSPQLLDLVRLDDRRRSRRRVRVTIAIAATAAVIAAVIAVPLVLARLAAPAPQILAFEEVVDVPLSASVTLTPVEWGTRLDLECSYPESTEDGAGTAWSYGLYVTRDDGTTSELSTWKITPGSKARIPAATELALADIDTVEIRPIGSEEVLLRATVED